MLENVTSTQQGPPALAWSVDNCTLGRAMAILGERWTFRRHPAARRHPPPGPDQPAGHARQPGLAGPGSLSRRGRPDAPRVPAHRQGPRAAADPARDQSVGRPAPRRSARSADEVRAPRLRAAVAPSGALRGWSPAREPARGRDPAGPRRAAVGRGSGPRARQEVDEVHRYRPGVPATHVSQGCSGRGGTSSAPRRRTSSLTRITRKTCGLPTPGSGRSARAAAPRWRSPRSVPRTPCGGRRG
jgi:hypothetical protein